MQKEVLKNNSKKIYDLREFVFSQPYEHETFNLEIPERESVLKYLYLNDGHYVETSFSDESSQNIFERYSDITELFPPILKHEVILPLFINWIVEKLIFIKILAQTSDSAYTIFESMNDRGLKLTQTELLKSYLLSNVKDETQIKELDISWKKKIALLKVYSLDGDQGFFKAWLRAKYAVSIRTSEKNATNQDFEKIATRFSNWVQDNSKRLLLLDPEEPETFYFFVHSDFHFYSDLYIRLSEMEISEELPEHSLKLMSFKGIAPSLSYPFILSSIKKIDDEETISQKINLTVNYLDSLGVYRMLLNEPITQTSIDYSINKKIKEIRDVEIDVLRSKFSHEIKEYINLFLTKTPYITFDANISKYILSRLYLKKLKESYFENIYFQRKKDSYVLYQFLTYDDVEPSVHKIPKGLKDIFISNLCSYTIVPKYLIEDLSKMQIMKRLQYLIKHSYINEFSESDEIDPDNLKDFFMKRNKKLLELIISLWKI